MKKEKNFIAMFLVSLVLVGVYIGLQLIVAFIIEIALYIKMAGEMVNIGDLDALDVVSDYYISSGWATITNFIATLISMIAAIFLYKMIIMRDDDEEQRARYRQNALSRRGIYDGIAVGMVCYTCALVISGFVAAAFPEWLESFEDLLDTVESGNEVLMFLAAVIFAPVGEELLFRGLVFTRLKKSGKCILALIVQALLFGAFHMNLFQAIYVIPIGLMTGLLAQKYRNVIPAIVAHAMNNLISTLMGYLPEDSLLQGYLLLVIMVISAFYCIEVFYRFCNGSRIDFCE